MRVYLDSCCYNRPYDDLEQERILVEGEAVLNILSKALDGKHEILGSYALEYDQ
ncbi:MAG: hypothetical protein LUH18_01305 [Oscillospiraceae bacterium]|nr:hypothetical protein [Oscillospiraceae bacterium]